MKLDIRTLSASLVAGFVSWYLCAGIYNKNADSMWTPLLVALFFLVLAAITCLVVRLTTGRRTRFMQFKGIGQIMTMLAVGLVALMTLIYGNCPELFQIDGNATYYYNSVDRDGEKMVTGISELSYHMDEDTYRRAYQQCDRIVQEVVSGAAGLSAREAELHAYRYVTGHCVYDLSTPYCGTPYGALVEGRAKCDGTGKPCNGSWSRWESFACRFPARPWTAGTGTSGMWRKLTAYFMIWMPPLTWETRGTSCCMAGSMWMTT